MSMLTSNHENIILQNAQSELGFNQAGDTLSCIQHISPVIN